MKRNFGCCFSIFVVWIGTILIYLLLAGAPLNAQLSPLHKPIRDSGSSTIPVEAWVKVRQALEQDGLGDTLLAGPASQTIRIKQKAMLLASGSEHIPCLGFSVAVSGDTVVVGAIQKSFGGRANQRRRLYL